MEKNLQEKNSNRQIKAGAVMSYLAIAINMFAGMVYTPWMIKMIGQSSYGLYTLASSLISMFMVDFGISSAISKFISQYLAEDNEKAINNFLGLVYKLYFIIDAIILVVFIGVYFNLSTIYANLTSSELSIFKAIFVIIAIYNLFTFPFVTLNGILTSYEKFYKLKLCGIISKVGSVTCTFIALAIGRGLFALVLINITWNLLAISYKLYIVKKETETKTNFKFWDTNLLKEIFSFSIWTTIISIMSRLVFNIMPSILARFCGAASIAVFGLASTLEGYVYTFSDAINGMFLSKTVRVANSDNRDKDMLSLMIRVGRINLSVVALIIVGFAVSGRDFIYLWLGEGYEIVYICTMCMIIPSIIYCPQQIGRTALIAENKIKYQAFIYIIVCLLNVVLATILCPEFGVFGGAIAIAVTYSLRLLLMSIVFHTKLNLNMFKFFYNCYGKMFIPVLITFLFGEVIFHVMVYRTYIIFAAKCFMVVVVYVLSMWLWGWNDSEKGIIKGMLGVQKKVT